MQRLVNMEALAFGTQEQLFRPCVDCGLFTGCFCDGLGQPCFAAIRVPRERWARGQQTPLCTLCDRTMGVCHFCRGQAWCVPPSHHMQDPQRPEEGQPDAAFQIDPDNPANKAPQLRSLM